MDWEVMEIIDQMFRKNDYDDAEAHLEKLISEEKSDRFKSILGEHFTNRPKDVLKIINDFIKKAGKEIKIKAVYIEMNEFDCNGDDWWFSLFGFDTYEPDPDELDWLSDWQAQTHELIHLTGLEATQADYVWYDTERKEGDRTCSRIKELNEILVMVRFVMLIRKALASGPLVKKTPVLATAYDFDVIGRFV